MRINKINCLILKEMTWTIDLLYKLFLRCRVVFQKQFFFIYMSKIQTIKSGFKEVVRIQIIHQLKAIGSSKLQLHLSHGIFLSFPVSKLH